MILYYHDGSTLCCSEIEISGTRLLCDEVWEVPIDEIERIEEEGGNDK